MKALLYDLSAWLWRFVSTYYGFNKACGIDNLYYKLVGVTAWSSTDYRK